MDSAMTDVEFYDPSQDLDIPMHTPVTLWSPKSTPRSTTEDTEQKAQAESSGQGIKKRPKARTLRDADWKPYDDRLIELNINQKVPLPRVMEIFKQEHGFEAT